ncbi:MAG: ParA family protein [Desulfobacterales bacterium]|nr:ParA family protein [Desulfobacterales bacterium]
MTISGQRGGAGKSVTALNLAVSLSLFEKKTLLVDCDPQGCVSEWSGAGCMEHPFDLASVLSGKATTIEAISKTEFSYLDILPAGFNLFQVALKLSRLVANEKILRLLMADIREDYDYIILDAPSSYGYMSIAALAAADWLVVATPPQDNWVEDFHSLLKSIQYIRKTHDTTLRIAGLLFNRCSDTAEIFEGMSGQLLEDTKNLIYETMIPKDDAVDEAINKKIPLALHDIKSGSADGYLNAAREVIMAFN